MKNKQGGNEEKPTLRKVKLVTSAKETRHSQRDHKDKEGDRSGQADPSTSTSAAGRVVTDEQYRARVSQKAYALYEERQAATHLDDWFEAERLVKKELLAEGHWAGSV
jgi:hypothetical protein